jgi:hypothetical protein
MNVLVDIGGTCMKVLISERDAHRAKVRHVLEHLQTAASGRVAVVPAPGAR